MVAVRGVERDNILRPGHSLWKARTRSACLRPAFRKGTLTAAIRPTSPMRVGGIAVVETGARKHHECSPTGGRACGAVDFEHGEGC